MGYSGGKVRVELVLELDQTLTNIFVYLSRQGGFGHQERKVVW